MKRFAIFVFLLVGVAAFAQQRGQEPSPAAQQPGGGGRGRGLTPEQQAALAAQTELEKNPPQIPYDAVALPLMPTGHTIDETGKYIKEWGQNAYGFSFAHAIRFDKEDNLFVIDEGSNMVMKFNPQGLVTLVLGRKDEAVDYMERFLEEGRKTDPAVRTGPGSGAGRGGSFGRPTDVAFDLQGNIFVADGYTK